MNRIPHASVRMNHRRRGAAFVLFMVILLLLMMAAGAMTQYVMLQRSQTESQLLSTQSDWLLQSGLERAVSQLRQDPNYAGETWTVSVASSGSPRDGELMIAVSSGPGADQRVVDVRATVDPGQPERASRSRQFLVSTAIQKTNPERE